MIGSVFASSMTITAKNDSKFLVIETNSAIATLQTDNSTSATATKTSDSLYQVAHVETAGTQICAFSWYTKVADKPFASTPIGAETTPDITVDDQYYVFKNTFYITTVVGSTDMTNLKVVHVLFQKIRLIKC